MKNNPRHSEKAPFADGPLGSERQKIVVSSAKGTAFSGCPVRDLRARRTGLQLGCYH
jgi:hypothetical protein